MLTKKQFLDKHRRKYDALGLSDEERNRRWHSYEQSERSRLYTDEQFASRVGPGSVDLSKQLVRGGKLSRELDARGLEQAIKHFLAWDRYLQMLMDPFNKPPARMPDTHLRKTVVRTLRWELPIISDEWGNAAIYFKAGIGRNHAVSNAHSSTADPTEPLPSIIFNQPDPSGYANTPALPSPLPAWGTGGTRGGYTDLTVAMVTELLDSPQTEELTSMLNSYRPLAGGFRTVYSGKSDQVEGLWKVANIPGGANAPHAANYGFNLNANKTIGNVGPLVDAPLDVPAQQVGPAWESISRLPGSQEHTVKQGFTAIYHPSVLAAIKKFRPTSHRPPLINPRALAMLSNQISTVDPTCGGNGYLVPPVCNSDPDEFRAYMDMLTNLNLYANPSSTAPRFPGTNFTDRGLLFNLLEGNGTASAAGQLDAIKNQMEWFGASMVGVGDNQLMAVCKGAPASTMLGNVEFVLHIEGLEETRQLTSAEVQPFARAAQHALHDHVISALPVSTPGKNKPASVASVAKDVASTIESVAHSTGRAVSAGKDILGTVAEIGEVLGGVLSVF